MLLIRRSQSFSYSLVLTLLFICRVKQIINYKLSLFNARTEWTLEVMTTPSENLCWVLTRTTRKTCLHAAADSGQQPLTD